MHSNAVFCATNAIIKVAGRECGRIQDLTITETYNLQKMSTMHNREVQSFVPGQVNINITAQKAYVEYDTFLTEIKTASEIANTGLEALSLYKNSQTGINSLVANAFSLGRSFISSISKDVNFTTRYPGDPTIKPNTNNMRSNSGSIGLLFGCSLFDIEILRPYGNDLSKFANNKDREFIPIWTIEGCQLNSKTISLNVSRVVIMENLSIVAKKFKDSSTLRYGGVDQDDYRYTPNKFA